MATLNIKDVLKNTKKAGAGFAYAKIWKFSAMQELSNALNLDVIADAKTIRRKLRAIRDAYVNAVIEGQKDSEKNFLNFMETFLESGITNFESSAILSSTTLNSDDAKAVLQKKRAETCMNKVKAYYEKTKKK